ncbi:MAG TPA: TlpA disulfide reductase family protein [Pirellulaceae bacterium]|nr:TlpA disulfide reductase family protein [Pirellulaceae bacterium]
MIATLAMFAVAGLMADDVTVKLVPSGVTEKVGGYSPLRAEMNGKAELVKKAPEGLTAPKYGTIKIGTKGWTFILDEPEGQPAKLYVDANGDGDLTNDPATTWDSSTTNGLTQYRGKAQVDLGEGKLVGLGLYRFDPKDTGRAQVKNTLMYYTDFGYEVTLDLDGKPHTSFFSGDAAKVRMLWVDRDGNGKQSYKLETIQVGKPFNYTGTTYVLNAGAGGLKLEKSSESLPKAPLPPVLTIGKQALPFEMASTSGNKIVFPKAYAGKLVMLDFWATWCGPCIAELPNVKKAYADWHDKGFEIVGISFDRADMGEKLKKFTTENDMPWEQIYEGKYWDTSLGELYDVGGIPFVLLVDGDTGEILANAEQLRGPGCSEYIGKALAKKNGK